MAQEIHAQQAVDMRTVGELEYADFDLTDLPVTDRQRIQPVHRRRDPAVGSAENALLAGIRITAPRKYRRSQDGHAGTGIRHGD